MIICFVFLGEDSGEGEPSVGAGPHLDLGPRRPPHLPRHPRLLPRHHSQGKAWELEKLLNFLYLFIYLFIYKGPIFVFCPIVPLLS